MSGPEATYRKGAGAEPTHLASQADPGVLGPGTALVNGTYVVEHRLGSGGMGDVWRARNTVTGAPCAIKVVRAELVADEHALTLFRREAEALKTIRDGAVVGYEGAFRDADGRVFLVMQFVDGPSLAQRMGERPLGTDEVLRLARRLARGLAAAHAVGVLHRDLSPDNVLLPRGDLDQAVIIDFGIAKRLGESGPTVFGPASGSFTGKYSYASPEQCGAVDQPPGARSDIYSLALVLAAAARGRPIPMGSDPISAQAARRKVPDLGGLAPQLRRLLAPMLAPDPAARPASMEEVSRMAASGPAAGPGSPLRWVALGVVLLAAAGAGTFVLLEPSPPPLPVTPAAPVPPAGPATAPPSTGTIPETASTVIPQPALASARTQLAALVLARPCAQVQWQLADDGALQLHGTIPSGELEALLQSVRAVPGVTRVEGAPQEVPAAHCLAAERIAALAPPTPATAPSIRLGRPDGVFSAARDVFTATVRAPPGAGGYLYVDYFHENGDVYHLLPESMTPDNRVEPGGTLQLGHPAQGARADQRVWRLSEPFGEGTITAILSPEPLYEGLRPIAENGAEYVAFLETALPAMAARGPVGSAEVPLRTTP